MNRWAERLTPLFLLLLLAGLLAACGGDPNAPGTLQGQIVDAQGEGLAGMTIAIYGLQSVGQIDKGSLYQKQSLLQEQSTGDDGRFSIVLEPGRYVVQVEKDGAVLGSRIMEVRANRVETADFQVEGSSRGAVYMARMFARGVSPWR